MGCFMNILLQDMMMFTIIGIPFGMQTLKYENALPCRRQKRFVAGNVPTVASMC